MTPTKVILITLAVIMVIMTTTVSSRRFNFIQDDLNDMIKSNNLQNNQQDSLDAGKNELALVTFPPSQGKFFISVENITWAMTTQSNFTVQFTNMKVTKCDIMAMSFAIDRTTNKDDGFIFTRDISAKYDQDLQQSVLRNIPIKFESPLSSQHDFEIKLICTYTELLDDLNLVRASLTLLANEAYVSTPTQIITKVEPFTTKAYTSQICRPNAAGDRVIFPCFTLTPSMQLNTGSKIYMTELLTPRSMNATLCKLIVADQSNMVSMSYDDTYQSHGQHGFKFSLPQSIPANTETKLDCVINKDHTHYYGPVSNRPMFWTFRQIDSDGNVKAASYYYITDGYVSCSSW